VVFEWGPIFLWRPFEGGPQGRVRQYDYPETIPPKVIENSRSMSAICISRRGVFYRYDRVLDPLDHKPVSMLMNGPYGTETPYDERWDRRSNLSEFNCQRQWLPPAMEADLRRRFPREYGPKLRVQGPFVKPLLPGHGFLVNRRGAGSRTKPIALYDGAGRFLRWMPFNERDYEPQDLRHHPWKGAYFHFEAHPKYKRRTGSPGAHWIWPDGRTQAVALASDPGLDRWAPTRLGFAVYKEDFDGEGNLRRTGLYLYRAGRARKLLAGQVWEIEVSPDGCKLSFVHAPFSLAWTFKYEHLWRFFTVKAIDLCAQRGAILALPDRPME
jgi:hypothetical protein